MKTYFMSQDLWDIVDSDFNNLENPTVQQLRQLKKDQQKDAKALFELQQALDDTFFKDHGSHNIKGSMRYFEGGVSRKRQGACS
ncbi:unnamed protein product [Prunus armeniaca]